MNAMTMSVAGPAYFRQGEGQGLVPPLSPRTKDSADYLIDAAAKIVRQVKGSSAIPVATLHRNVQHREQLNSRQVCCRVRSSVRAKFSQRRA